MSRTVFVILQGPDQSADFARVSENLVCVVLIFCLIVTARKKSFRKSPCMTCNRGSKVAVLHPPLPPLNEGLALTNPVFCPTSSTYQKHLKLGQCLEIDNRRPLSKFGDVTLPSSHFTDRSVFYRPAFYRLVCKIVNL